MNTPPVIFPGRSIFRCASCPAVCGNSRSAEKSWRIAAVLTAFWHLRPLRSFVSAAGRFGVWRMDFRNGRPQDFRSWSVSTVSRRDLYRGALLLLGTRADQAARYDAARRVLG